MEAEGSGGGADVRDAEEAGIADDDRVEVGAIEGGFGRDEGAGETPTAGVLASETGAGGGATATFDTDGGGGTVDVFTELFFPRPSKISRSEPPLFSFDIRVSCKSMLSLARARGQIEAPHGIDPRSGKDPKSALYDKKA